MASLSMFDSSKTAAETPTSITSRIVQITPIILTVLATALAGLSSSEMTQSMYYRSLAGQHQAKAGDQWAFFQAKRIRGTSLEGTTTLLHSLAHVERLDPTRLKNSTTEVVRWLGSATPEGAKLAQASQTELDAWFTATQADQSLKYLLGPALPTITEKQLPDTDTYRNLRTAIIAMSRRHSERELAALVKDIDPVLIEEATQIAEENADAFDHACEPAASAVKHFRELIEKLSTGVDAASAALRNRESAANPSSTDAKIREPLNQVSVSVEAMSSDFDSRRYRRESVYNRKAAELYELRVARSSVSSDAHRERSRRFFCSMLLAQAGVTISSLALARANRSLFWTLAALAGVSALAFTGFTYFSLN